MSKFKVLPASAANFIDVTKRLLMGAFLFCVVLEIQAAASSPGQAVASAHPLATDAGLEILAKGGNAFDAAVAVSAVLGVVEPYSSGFGGGGFWLLHRAKDQKDILLDGREMAPSAANSSMFLDAAGNPVDSLSVDGALAAAIPGQPAALVQIAQQYGRLPLSVSLAPAILVARKGFPVDVIYQARAKARLAELSASSEAARIFLQKGKVPAVGTLIRQPDLANSIERIAKFGRQGFYAGVTAQQLVAAVQSAGGIWTLKDLQDYQVKERQPIKGIFRGYEIVSAPPPSSGGIAILTILKQLEERGWPLKAAVAEKHLVVEAMRRAYRDRAQHLGDPDFVSVPQNELLSSARIRNLAASISSSQATRSDQLSDPKMKKVSDHTTHFSLIDGDGNYVAATLSINLLFGSAFVAKGTGILLNDEMDDFSVKPGVANAFGLVGGDANAVAPGKRPLSSMSPTFVRSADGVLILGTPGGSRIISMVALGILDFVQHKDLGRMVSLPRYHHQYLPDEIQFEPSGFSQVEQSQLQGMGHQLKPLEDTYGNMQAVYWEFSTGRVDAAADSRGIGVAQVRNQR